MCLAYRCTLPISHLVMTRSSSLLSSPTCLSELAVNEVEDEESLATSLVFGDSQHHAAMPTMEGGHWLLSL